MATASQRLKSLLVWTIALAAIAVALVSTLVRLLLPMVADYRTEVEARVGERLGVPLRIGKVEARWGLGVPELVLGQVRLMDAAGDKVQLGFASLRLSLDVFASLWSRRLQIGAIRLDGLYLMLVRREDGRIEVHGWEAKGDGQVDLGWLLRTGKVEVRQAAIKVFDARSGSSWLFSGLDATLENAGPRHQLQGRVVPPAPLGGALHFAMDGTGADGDPRHWEIQGYVQADALRPGPWLAPWLAPEALAGAADLRLWGHWGQGAVQSVTAELAGLTIGAPSAPAARPDPVTAAPAGGEAPPGPAMPPVPAAVHRPQALAAELAWRRKPGGWALGLRSPATGDGASHWEVVADFGQAGADSLRLRAFDLPLPTLAALAAASPLVPGKLRDWFAHASLQARSSHLGLDLQRASATWLARARLDGLNGLPRGKLPGLRNIDLSVEARGGGNSGGVRLSAKGDALVWDRLAREDWPLGELSAVLDWQRGAKATEWKLKRLGFRNQDVAMGLQGRIRVPSGAGSPFLDLVGDIEYLDLKRLHAYLPVAVMPARGVAWLDRAILGGRAVGGGMVLRGALGDLPFSHQEGRLLVSLDLRDGILDYAPGWPLLKQLDAVLNLDRTLLSVHAGHAMLLNSRALEVDADVYLAERPMRVDLRTRMDVPVADIPRFILGSPMRRRFTSYVDGLEAVGRSRLELGLKLPLVHHPLVEIDGKLTLDSCRLNWRRAGIDLYRASGVLRFGNKHLDGRDLEARIWDLPVRIDVSAGSPKGNQVVFRGQVNQALVARFLGPAMAANFDGRSPWRMQATLPGKLEAGKPVAVRLESSLRGLRIDLPAPVGKTARLAVPLAVDGEVGGKPPYTWRARYGDRFNAVLELDGAYRPLRGEVRLGDGEARIPSGTGLVVKGRLPALDLDAWLGKLGPLLADGGKGASAPGGAVLVREVDFSTPRLRLAGQDLRPASLRAEWSRDGYIVDLASPQMEGRISVPTDMGKQPLALHLKRLYMVSGEGGKGLDLDPRRVPALRLDIDDFRFDGKPLGKLALSTEPVDRGLALKTLRLRSRVLDVDARGSWIRDQDGDLSSFDIDFSTPDLGDTLSAFGYAGSIKKGKTKGRISAFWRGPPTAFELARINGDMRMEIGPGRLLGVNPGAGRIFGLLSLQTLPRRLSLDFSDLYKKGLPFDRITGSYSLNDGNAYTNDLSLKGPVATIRVDGRVGLVAKDYDQVVMVEPGVSQSLGVAGAAGAVAIGSLGVGAALLLAQQLFQPQLNRITRTEYIMRGPWDHPDITRIKRKSKKPGLPVFP